MKPQPIRRASAKIPDGLPLRLAAFVLAIAVHGLVIFIGGSGGGSALSDSSNDFILSPAFRVLAPPPPVVVQPVEAPEPDAPVIASEKEEKAEEEEPEAVPDEPEPAESAELAAADTTDDGSSAEQEGIQDSGRASSGSGSGSGSGDGQGRSFWPIYKVDVRPEMVSEAELVYPEAARRQNREGSVIVELDITEDGLVEAAKVVRSAGYGFDEAAVAMLSASRFSPAQAGGRAVPVRARFTINFRLKD